MPRSKESSDHSTAQGSDIKDRKKPTKLGVPAQQQPPRSPPRSPIRAGLEALGVKLVQLSALNRRAPLSIATNRHQVHVESEYQQLLDICERQASDWQEVMDSEERPGLYSKVMKGKASFEECQQIARIALHSLVRMPRFFKPTLDSYPPLERNTRRSASIFKHQLCAMEIIENILKFCLPIDVVRLWRAHLTERINAVIELPQRQRYMDLSNDGDDAGNLHFPLSGMLKELGVEVKAGLMRSAPRLSPREGVEETDVRVVLEGEQFRDFGEMRKRLGSIEKKMLILLPPVHRLVLYIKCCSYDRGSYTPKKTIESNSGITVGAVLKTLAELRQEHQLCHLATRQVHDGEGFAHSEIEGTGQVRVSKDDPTVLRLKRERDRPRASIPPPRFTTSELEYHILAKNRGKSIVATAFCAF